MENTIRESDQGQSIRILHIDDDRDFVELTADYLERTEESIAVVTETDPTVGLDRFSGESIDCVVCDFQMPALNGLEVLDRVREEHPDLPFILFTGQGSEEVASEAIARGVTDYLQKQSGTEQFELLANRVTNAIQQYRATRRATELERIRQVLQTINQALVHAHTRAEIETRVCEIISNAEPYRFAWIGEHDVASQTIEPRAAAGIEEGYLDAIEITTDEEATGQGPTGRAIKTRELVVMQNIPENDAYEPWRTEALERGYQSSAAIPLIYDEMLYGVLNVYANRIDAFDEQERTLLQDVADDIAHAIYRAEMRSRQERYGRIIENLPVGVYRATPGVDGEIIEANPALARIFDADSVDGLIGRKPRKFYTDPEERADLSQQLQENGVVRNQELRQQTLIDDRIWVVVTAVRTEEGDRVYFDGIIQDVTERKEREQELEWKTRAMDKAPVGIILTDPTQEDNPIVYVNEHFKELTGYSEEDILGRNCRFLQGEETSTDPVADMREAIDNEEPITVELRNYRKDGAEFWNRVSIAPVENDEGKLTHFVGFQQEITDQKEYEQELELYQRAVEEAGHVVVITDRDGTIEYVNEEFEETTGYSREEVIGRNPRILKSGKHNDTFYENLWETILAGDIWEAELINQRKDGRFYHVEQTIAPITDSDGEIRHFVGIENDVTERRLREQRLSVLNRILRHNLRNAINVVREHASSLAETLDDEALRDRVTAIKKQANKLLEMSEHAMRVQELFQQESDVNSICDLGELLTELRDEFHEEYPDATITLTTPDSVHVQTDDRIAVAIREAVDNAVAHSDQAPPEVSITVTPPEATEAGEWVEIMIADNGPGIPEDEQRVIEVGEETPLLHGAGMGLWLIYWVVASFGGDVTISENDPRGSIVTLQLPAAAA